jgi:hypothetical protein
MREIGTRHLGRSVLHVVNRYKPRLKALLSRLGVRRPSANWILAEDNPPDADVLPSFGLFGVVVTWMEGDVIEATVRNAFAQGCERVLLVDNDSPDDTVERALAAGAELARSFSTPLQDEKVKIGLLNEVVAQTSIDDGRDHIWWMWLDADEFLHGPRGLTVRRFLAQLDQRFRLVGSRYFNHYPDREPQSVPGLHPLDLQPLCEELRGVFCHAGHRKHQLQRYDREGPTVTSQIGYHTASSSVSLVEPSEGCFTHHFPYRLEAVTRARAEALCGRNGSGTARIELRNQQTMRDSGNLSDMSKRSRTLDHVYAQRWSEVENLRRVGKPIGVEPRPWPDLVDPVHVTSARWYAPGDLPTTEATNSLD